MVSRVSVDGSWAPDRVFATAASPQLWRPEGLISLPSLIIVVQASCVMLVSVEDPSPGQSRHAHQQQQAQ